MPALACDACNLLTITVTISLF
ncbi:unnamed protein product [Leptidea sinapis]|uniref:Uncharacterized protein n=1 Tax=Leptidea sinapis TaxID=189913 RepID=A0A5E4Q356_9NEOP|nr:unnamed protein product [Leptidea sinapis]